MKFQPKEVKILLIDDNADIRNLISLIVENAGFTVLHAFDGTDGLQKTLDYKPNLILLGTMMPKLSGVELLSKIRKNKDPEINSIPIIEYINLLRENIDTTLSAQVEQFLDVIDRNSTTLLNLVAETLAHSNLESSSQLLEKEVIDVATSQVPSFEKMIDERRGGVLERAILALESCAVADLAGSCHEMIGALGFYHYESLAVEIKLFSDWLKERDSSDMEEFSSRRAELLGKLRLGSSADNNLGVS